MDVSAAGFAASQIASAQRGQQVAFASIKGQQKQDLDVANLLSQAVTAAKQASAAAPSVPQAPSAPSLDSGASGNAAAAAASGRTRGALIDILA